MECPRCGFECGDDSRFCSRCAAPLLPKKRKTSQGKKTSAPHTQTLDFPYMDIPWRKALAERYEIMEELGGGGMGRVFKVFDKKIKEIIALKIIRPEMTSKPKTIERFTNELKLSRKISHKNICKVFDLSEDEGTLFITMEYVQGEDLRSMLQMMGPLSIGQAVFLGSQVCEGLVEAHKQGVVHLDLKPKNIMVDRKGHARIMDFGISRSIIEPGASKSGMSIGSPEYMSPEQVEGKEIDSRSDIYSFGITLYEMMTGTVPFKGDTALNIAMKHRTEIPQDPRKINPQIPAPMSALILKCLAKDKEKRHQKVEEILDEFRQIEKTLPSAEKILSRKKPMVSREITVKFDPKKIWKTAAAALLVLGLLFVLFKTFSRKQTPGVSPGKPFLAVLYFQDNSGDESLSEWRIGLTCQIISNINQSKSDLAALFDDRLVEVLGRLDLLENERYSRKNLRQIVSRSRTTHVLWGNYTKSGDTLRINCNIRERFSWEPKTFSVEGEREEDMLELADQITERIYSYFRYSEADIRTMADETRKARVKVKPEAMEKYTFGRHYANRYAALELEEDFNKAVTRYLLAIDEDPAFALAYWGLGDVYEARFIASYDDAIKDDMISNYERAYGINPNLAETNAGMGWANFYRQDFEKAFQFFKTAAGRATESENSPLIWYNIGSFLRSIGLYRIAITYYEKAIDQDFNYYRAHMNLANCLMYLGEYESAAHRLEDIIDLDPEGLGLHLALARQWIFMDRMNEAENLLAKAEEIDPKNSRIAYHRALILAMRGKKEESLKLIQDRPPTGYYSTMVYAALGMKDEAIENIEKGIETGFEQNFDYMYPHSLLVSCPFFSGLRGDPRFEKIVEMQKVDHEEKLKKYGDL